MSKEEELMYAILNNISSTDLPIVFKGALITKLILSNNGFEDVSRSTEDIDGNWIGEAPSMESLVDGINRSLGGLSTRYYAKAYRQYDVKKSAGIYILDRNLNKNVLKMDISIKPVFGDKVYRIGDMSIRGVIADEILADKLCVLSGKYIFRRAKDIIDVYALSNCVDVNTASIFDICKLKGNEIKAFDEFYNRWHDVEHAYNKLRGVLGKPEFCDTYSHLDTFIKPFANKNRDLQWNHKTKIWETS